MPRVSIRPRPIPSDPCHDQVTGRAITVEMPLTERTKAVPFIGIVREGIGMSSLDDRQFFYAAYGPILWCGHRHYVEAEARKCLRRTVRFLDGHKHA